MRATIKNYGNSELTIYDHDDWSLLDVLKMLSNDKVSSGEISLEALNGILLTYCSGRVSVMDARSDFTVHFDDDEIDLVRVSTYEDKRNGKIEFFTTRAEFHITVWFGY